MYHLHPSVALKEAFSSRPFQGQEPERAKFVFIGLDANYDPEIETSGIFPQLLKYLRNGVHFWEEYGVHHPFMLPAYKGDGRFYHKTFSNIGFQLEHAADVSFIELLHVPTYGRSVLTPKDLDAVHLAKLDRAIMHGTARFVFISDAVARLMRASGHFSWLPQQPRSLGQPLKVWYYTPNKTIYWHYHFSVYGKFNEEKLKQLKAIGGLI
jgi:hypothetical protein